MRIAIAAVAACLLAVTHPVFSQGILYGGAGFQDRVDIQSLGGQGAFHFASVKATNDTETGQHFFPGGGNASDWQSQSFSVEAGGGGTIPVLFSFSGNETLNQTFTNFTVTEFAFHYGFTLLLHADSPFGTLVDTFQLDGGSPQVLLQLNEGTQYWLHGSVDAAAVEGAIGNSLWNPAVIDPMQPAYASTFISGEFLPLSLELVPEPGGLAIGATAILLATLQAFAKKTPR